MTTVQAIMAEPVRYGGLVCSRHTAWQDMVRCGCPSDLAAGMVVNWQSVDTAALGTRDYWNDDLTGPKVCTEIPW